MADEKVVAEYRDAQGNLLWREDPYPFKRKFAVGQNPMHPDRKQYVIVKADFAGEFGNGIIHYVVKALGLQKKAKSWWCQPCSQEVYSLRCKYCGKSEAEEK